MVIIPPILGQHAEEAAMLWLLRRAAIRAPHYSIADLAKLDGRVEAHLDGLRIAGEDGWKICEEQLAANEEGEVFAAAMLASEFTNPAFTAKVLAVVEQEPKLAGGLISALGWLPFEQVQSHVQPLLQSDNPVHQLVGIGAAAVHRRHHGEVLSHASRSDDRRLRARALKAVGELHDQKLARAVADALSDANPECRFAAAWSGALLGVAGVVPVLQEIAETIPRRSSAAAGMAVRRMGLSAALTWQKRLSGNPELRRLAIMVAGLIGDPVLVPWLNSQMGELPLARLAGEAFTFITGVDLAYRDLERKPPEDFNAGPTEDPKDENVEMDPDDNLPWPHPGLVQKWWQANEGNFAKGVRHLLGKPISVEWMEQVLRGGRQRQRAAAAIELAILRPGQPLFNVCAPGFRQQQILGKAEVIR